MFELGYLKKYSDLLGELLKLSLIIVFD